IYVSILIEKREGKIAANWLASEAADRNLIQDYLDKGLFRESDSRLLGQRFVPGSRPTNGNRDITVCGSSREINMMSADLRKLSDPQKELEAVDHIPSHKSQALQRVKRESDSRLLGQRFVPGSRPTNGNRDITVCGSSREINMMSADLRKLSDP
ncbi:hypothetical protein MTR67_018184, partial [Solanum verrucosum]